MSNRHLRCKIRFYNTSILIKIVTIRDLDDVLSHEGVGLLDELLPLSGFFEKSTFGGIRGRRAVRNHGGHGPTGDRAVIGVDLDEGGGVVLHELGGKPAQKGASHCSELENLEIVEK